MLSIVGCGNKDTADNNSQGSDVQNSQDKDAGQSNEKISDPEDGTVLEIDLSKKGDIKDDAPDINSNKIIFENKDIELPFSASVLFDNGWHFSSNTDAAEKLMKPNSTTDLISFYLYNENGDEIMLRQAINNSDSEKRVQECDISAFYVDTTQITESFGDVILPGGICLTSTAADVISVFGKPENNKYFENVYVYDDGITYENHKESGYTYSFHFYNEEDYDGELNGYIHKLTIES